MAELHAASRNALADRVFGLPNQRKYPIPDKVHARVAKSYASKEFHAGKLSASQKAQIDSKANRKLKGKSL
jgi:hypothetical protein